MDLKPGAPIQIISTDTLEADTIRARQRVYKGQYLRSNAAGLTVDTMARVIFLPWHTIKEVYWSGAIEVTYRPEPKD